MQEEGRERVAAEGLGEEREQRVDSRGEGFVFFGQGGAVAAELDFLRDDGGAEDAALGAVFGFEGGGGGGGGGGGFGAGDEGVDFVAEVGEGGGEVLSGGVGPVGEAEFGAAGVHGGEEPVDEGDEVGGGELAHGVFEGERAGGLVDVDPLA